MQSDDDADDDGALSHQPVEGAMETVCLPILKPQMALEIGWVCTVQPFPEEEIFSFSFKTYFICMCVNAGAHRGQKRASEPLVLALQVMSLLWWVQTTRLSPSSARVVNC